MNEKRHPISIWTERVDRKYAPLKVIRNQESTYLAQILRDGADKGTTLQYIQAQLALEVQGFYNLGPNKLSISQESGGVGYHPIGMRAYTVSGDPAHGTE
jgi:hypothetical protein